MISWQSHVVISGDQDMTIKRIAIGSENGHICITQHRIAGIAGVPTNVLQFQTFAFQNF